MKARIEVTIDIDVEDYGEVTKRLDDIVGGLFTAITDRELKSIKMEVEQ